MHLLAQRNEFCRIIIRILRIEFFVRVGQLGAQITGPGHAGTAAGLGPPVAQSKVRPCGRPAAPVPPAICVRQPMLPAATRSGEVAPMFAILRSRSRRRFPVAGGCRSPAEPQHSDPQAGQHDETRGPEQRFGSSRTPDRAAASRRL